MVELMCFPLAGREVDLAVEIGVHYFTFGVHLLQDSTGSQVGALEKEMGKNAQDINHRIFALWLQGKGRQPVTWDTLVTVLKESKLHQLAKDISDVKLRS